MAQWHRSAESESLRFDSLKGTGRFSLPHAHEKTQKGFFFSKFLSGLAQTRRHGIKGGFPEKVMIHLSIKRRRVTRMENMYDDVEV